MLLAFRRVIEQKSLNGFKRSVVFSVISNRFHKQRVPRHVLAGESEAVAIEGVGQPVVLVIFYVGESMAHNETGKKRTAYRR